MTRQISYLFLLEVMEDIALSRAMEEGENTPIVEEKNILEVLGVP